MKYGVLEERFFYTYYTMRRCFIKRLIYFQSSHKVFKSNNLKTDYRQPLRSIRTKIEKNFIPRLKALAIRGTVRSYLVLDKVCTPHECNR